MKSEQDKNHFSCPTCKDEGLPARVLRIDETTQNAIALFSGGEQREVSLVLLSEVHVGDYVLVHLDTAIAKLDAAHVIEA